MFLRSVRSESLCGDFKFSSSVTEGHEGQYPHKHANSLALGGRQSSDMRHTNIWNLTWTLLRVAVSTACTVQHLCSLPLVDNKPVNSPVANYQNTHAVMY